MVNLSKEISDKNTVSHTATETQGRGRGVMCVCEVEWAQIEQPYP